MNEAEQRKSTESKASKVRRKLHFANEIVQVRAVVSSSSNMEDSISTSEAPQMTYGM